MKDDSKIYDLSPSEAVGPGGPIEDSQSPSPRPRKKRTDLGSAASPVASEANPESQRLGAGEEATRQLQIVEPDESGPKLNRLLVEQLSFSVPRAHADEKPDVQRELGAIELYQDFKPVDAADSAVARVAVGLTIATMECLQRADSANLDVRQTELRLGQKCAAALIQVLTFLDKRRGLSTQVNVGSVNVGSGGQAIVGTVQPAPKAEAKPSARRRGTCSALRKVGNAKPPRT